MPPVPRPRPTGPQPSGTQWHWPSDGERAGSGERGLTVQYYGGAEGGTRTPTPLRALDPETAQALRRRSHTVEHGILWSYDCPRQERRFGVRRLATEWDRQSRVNMAD